MDYQLRLIREYGTLEQKITKLDSFISNIESTEEKERLELMCQQLEAMQRYSNLLEQRLLLEMKEGKEWNLIQLC